MQIMQGMNSQTVDLIYLDPPFKSDKKWQRPMEGKLKLALDILIKAGADNDPELYRQWSDYVDKNRDDNDQLIMKFDDAWEYNSSKEIQQETKIRNQYPALHQFIEAVGMSHGLKMKAYLIFMGLRLIEMRRILKPTGSIYLHCDPTAGHYLKMLLDCIFGSESFQNEIIWSYGLGGSSKWRYSRKHDNIYFYTVSDQYFFNKPQIPATSQMLKGKMKGATDVWNIPSLNNMSQERTGYPTQKPVALLERIVEASSREGDIVFDPFCGCATAIVAAYKLGRRWIGCDLSFVTVPLVKYRLEANARAICGYRMNSSKPPLRSDTFNENSTPTLETKLNSKERSDVKEYYYGKQRGVCNGCGHAYDYKIFALDHVKAKSKGGSDERGNFQLLCGPCNSKKGAKDETDCHWMYKFKRAA